MKFKKKERLEPHELSARLHALADEISSGNLEVDDLSVSLPKRPALMKLEVEQEEGELEIELKISFPKSDFSLSGKGLKKEMEAVFKILARELSAGNLPPLKEAERFVELHRLYTPFAEAFREGWMESLRLAEGLLEAIRREDLSESRGLLERIAISKKTCHKLYKK